MAHGGWRSGQVLAWTEREGPQPPPPGPGRTAPAVLAGTLGVVFLGMLGTDSLCPEHRVLVQAFATFALVGIVASIIGLVRGSALASFTTLVSALAGVAIGFLDAAHDPTRGRLLALGFGVVAAAAAVLAARQAALMRWDRAVEAELAPPPAADGGAPSLPASVAPAAETGVPAPPEVPSLK
ncbi:MAG: hypothetical protein AVDCRST_MAG76-2320 [uncultured Acidimicrobiales bacterium]|uniref:Uncharacterized protein n=1 Tax=uncultured Acidimicrobiales bacterium TaxID=310071 RepID=A0A6J4IIQ7_9ACTN|nr:MAG: hypothetical protein AVDCRST_MAG76-2320 [uncultured Acidimicrobiales bacterium]